MSERARLPGARVRSLSRRVAIQLALAAVVGVVALLGILLVSSWALSQSALWPRPSAIPLLLLVLTSSSAAVWLWRIAARARGWDWRAAAAEVERRAELRSGSVRGAAEPEVERPGISRALLELHRKRLGLRLARFSLADLGGPKARSARAHLFASALVATPALILAALLWIGSPGSAAPAWAAVLRPLEHLKAPPLPPLSIAASDRIRRGEDLPVDVGAEGRDSVRLGWQPEGELAAGRWHPVRAGRARAVVPRVEALTRLWVTALDGAVSDTLSVLPVDPLLLIDVEVALHYPPHTHREREIASTPLPLLSVPEGTRAIVSGRTTASIESAALRAEDGREISFEVVADRRFRRAFRVRSGTWGWQIAGRGGEALEGEPDSLYFVTVPDSVPLVRVAYPGVDTLLHPSMTQPLLIDVRDDYGLSKVELVSWRVSAWGEAWPSTAEAVPLADDAPRANLAAVLDARGRGFLPGDTLHYFVQAYDNAPEPGVGRSREYVLRLPTLDEIRDQTIADSRELLEAVERLAGRAREQQEATEALDRAGEVQPPPGGDGGPAGGEMEFRDTEAARRALEEAEDLLERAEAVQDALRELQAGIERAGLNDPGVLDRLREIEALYERILTPELREKIESLREALSELDPERVRDAIRQLAEGSADFRERVERSVELLQRAALEQEFSTLETQAEELAGAQKELAEATEGAREAGNAERLERRADELSQRADSLSDRIGDFADELREASERTAGERAAEAETRSAEAARSDQQAASQMRRSPQSARRSAQRATDQMRQAASSLREGREGMQENWRQEVVEALSRAQAEALELARRQQTLNQQLGEAEADQLSDLRSEEVALKRGLDQIEQQLGEAAQTSLLVDPSLLGAAARVESDLERLLEQLADGTRRRRVSEGLASRVSEGLNELAYQLMQAGEDAAGAESGTGMQEALEQLAQLAQQQGELNQQAGGITPGSLSDALLQALRQLAAEQRTIAEGLESLSRELGPRGQVLGRLDDMMREADDIARQLDRGRLNERIIERQGELFRRLLDAGRSLEQDEFEKERRAERPGVVEILRPDAIPAEQLRGPQFPHPGSEALNQYPPAFRRLILEYFDRLNEQERADDS